MSLPNKLYKYESWNEYSLANLKNQQLYFSKPRSFNDPFDCSIDCQFEDITEEQYDLLHDRYLKVAPDKSHFRKRFGNTPTDDFKTFIRLVLEGELKESTNCSFDHGVTCFSETKDEILMWSHYSGSHTGFCLEFDTSFDPFSKAQQVRYKEDFPKVNPAKIILDPSLPEALKAYLTKHKSWEYEKEWRSFHEEGNRLFGYPAESLTAVYFGAKMNPAHLEIIALIIQGQNSQTTFHRGRKSQSQFKVKFDQIEYTSYLEAQRKGLA